MSHHLSHHLSPEAVLPPYVGIDIAHVLMVRGADDLRTAREFLLAADAVGFDTESKPTFRKGEVSTGPHLIQLATDQRVFLFPVIPASGTDTHSLLAEVLASERIVKAGFGLRDDLKRLKSKLGVEAARVVDLAVVLRKEPRKDIGAKTAVAQFFGQRLQKSKSISTTNWANPNLTERQILYAADDAHVALRIYRRWAMTKNPVVPA